MDRSDLIVSFRDTVSFASESQLIEATNAAKASSKVYPEGFCAGARRYGQGGQIIVEENTTFAAARKYRHDGRVAVLNFANPEYPGGGVTNGAMAQEECLCRSSNLYPCLSDGRVFADYYEFHRGMGTRFYSDRLIYTQGVTVFKDDAVIPVLMPQNGWFEVDVITCAAPYLAERRYTDREALKSLFKRRIQNIFEAAIDNEAEVLILGAFGCGAFKNPPDVVASAFKEIIEENGYREAFRKIVFAIKKTGEVCPNLLAFESAFNDTLQKCEPDELNEWQKKNIYFGKQFSILGDSISTLEGYNPKGYNLFFTGDTCFRAGVYDMKDTWWGKVIDFFGGELLVNNSWSGSRVTKVPGYEGLFPSGCSDERTNGLHLGNVTPDVIIVYLGTNDWGFGAAAGAGDISKFGISLSDSGNYEVFRSAYEAMLTKLKGNYPSSDIWCCTLSKTFMSMQPSFVFPDCYGGTHIEVYNDIIREVADLCECHLIDLYRHNMPYDSLDGSHPTATGMNTLATICIQEISVKLAEKVRAKNEMTGTVTGSPVNGKG